jgi:hypothetical protein
MSKIFLVASAILVATAALTALLVGRDLASIAGSTPKCCNLAQHTANTSGPSEVYGFAFFQQPIHHADHSIGFFGEFYFWNASFWKGSGSPIVIFLPGETDASSFHSFSRPEVSTVGMIAERIGAAVLILEHRYYGKSSPFHNLTTENLAYLTVENSMKDIIRFAQNFEAPWAPGIPSSAADVPFVLIGGSYAGALTGWIANTLPGIFWSYLAVSPTLQAKTDYWEYMLPAIEYGESSCVNSLAEVVEYIDITLTGTPKEAQELKKLFGLGAMEHNDDFVLAIMMPILSWRDQNFSNDQSSWHELCERIQDQNADGLRLKEAPQALGAFVNFSKSLNVGYCDRERCTSSYDARSRRYTDTTVANAANRQFFWLQCNHNLGGWITTAPREKSNITLVSRLLTVEYWRRQCSLFFPTTQSRESFSNGEYRSDAQMNAYTGGWTPSNARRIIYSSGEKDSWRELGPAAHLRPGGPLESDLQRDIVVEVVPGGWHASDLMTHSAELDSSTKTVRDREVTQIYEWVQQWYTVDAVSH